METVKSEDQEGSREKDEKMIKMNKTSKNLKLEKLFFIYK